MSQPSAHDLSWCTACSAAPPDLNAAEVSHLQAHLMLCERQRRWGERWQCAAQDLLVMISARLLTTGLLIVAAVLLLQAL